MPTSKSSDDLFAEFSDTFTSPAVPAPSMPMPTQPPPPNPFAAQAGGFGGAGAGFGAPAGGFGAPAAGGFGAPAGGFGQPAAFQSSGFQQQQPAPAAFQSAWGPPQPQAQQQPAMGGFGAPMAGQQQKPTSDPFGGGFGGSGGGFDAFTLQPQSTAPPPGQQPSAAGKPDPFGDIAVLGGGSKPAPGGKKQDPFKGFKMAKPGEVAVPDFKMQGTSNLSLPLDDVDDGHESSEEFSLPSPQGPPPPLPTNIHIEDSEEANTTIVPPPPPPRPSHRHSTSSLSSLKDNITPPPITPRSNTSIPLPIIPPRHRSPSSTSTVSSSSLQSEMDALRGPPSTSSSLSTPSPSMSRNPHSCPSKLAAAYSPLLESDDQHSNQTAVNMHSPATVNMHSPATGQTAAKINSCQTCSMDDISCEDGMQQDVSTNGPVQHQSVSPQPPCSTSSSPSPSSHNHRQQNCINNNVSPSSPTLSDNNFSSPDSGLGSCLSPAGVDAASMMAADALLLSSSAPTNNNSFHVNMSNLSSSMSIPSLNNKSKLTTATSLPKHEDPFADDPFNEGDAPSISKTIVSNKHSSSSSDVGIVFATSSDKWADFSSEPNVDNRTPNANAIIHEINEQNGGLTNVSDWTDPFGAPAAGGNKGITTSDGKPLFDDSPFGF